MNLSVVGSNINNHNSHDNYEDNIGGIGGRSRNSNNGNHMSLRNLFANRGREGSLRLEDLSSPHGPRGNVEKQKSRGQEQDVGLAAAMSIARLFVSSADASDRRKQRFRVQNEDLSPEGLEEDSVASPEDDDVEEGRTALLDEKRLQKVLDKVNAMRAEHDEILRKERLKIDDLERENADLRARLRRAAQDVDDKHSMAEYAKLITEQMQSSSGTVSDSQYVLKLQSQLCRALHKMGVMTNQIEMLQSQKDDKVRTLQSQLVEQGNESFRAEVDHMNDLLEMEKEMECLREEHESESSVQQASMAKMEVELELERSLRCDAMSYVRRTKEDMDHDGARRTGRRARRRRTQEDRERRQRKRMSKRDSEMSDATAVAANTSDKGINHALIAEEDESDRLEREIELSLQQMVAGVEMEMPLNFGDDLGESDEEEDEQEAVEAKQQRAPRSSSRATAEQATERDEDVASLRSRLEESLLAVEELKKTVSEQRRTIERLALDHGEQHEQRCSGEVASGQGARRSRRSMSS